MSEQESSKEYKEGIAACDKGKEKKDNPYPTDTQAHYDWAEGWQNRYDYWNGNYY